MTTFLLLFASLALVALIGAVLVYAVHRVVTWSVDRVEGGGGILTSSVPAETSTSAPTVLAPPSDPVETAPRSTGPTDLPPTPVVSTPAASARTMTTPATSTPATSTPTAPTQAVEPESGAASTAA